MRNGKTVSEKLRQDELIKSKTGKEIKTELKIFSEISIDQIAEHIIQFSIIDRQIIVGLCCNGLSVCIGPRDDGRVSIYAGVLGMWCCGGHILSQQF